MKTYRIELVEDINNQELSFPVIQNISIEGVSPLLACVDLERILKTILCDRYEILFKREKWCGGFLLIASVKEPDYLETRVLKYGILSLGGCS